MERGGGSYRIQVCYNSFFTIPPVNDIENTLIPPPTTLERKETYCIYSNKYPGRLLNILPFGLGCLFEVQHKFE